MASGWGKSPENYWQAILWQDIGEIEKKHRATSRGILFEEKQCPRILPFSNQSLRFAFER
jgi:hypothetical protein